MIVYVGNMLSKHGSSINFMELLVPRLAPHYTLVAASSRQNKFLRLLDMLRCVWVNRRRCKMVLIDTYSTQAFLYAFLVSRISHQLGIPYVPVLHGGNLPERFSSDSKKVSRFLQEAYAIVSPSLYLKEFFSSKGFTVKFIPNFVEIERYQFIKRGLSRGKILWVRAFHEIYNPPLAIEALKLVRGRFPDAELCMVGAAKDHTFQEVKTLIEQYGLQSATTITGILPKAEWIKLAADYDIFINTTTIDNMPISVIEAMALGLPVVSTNVGGIPFLIKNGFEGLLTDPGSAESMAKSICSLIENPDLGGELATNARQKVEAFDWKIVKGQWFDLIDKILK